MILRLPIQGWETEIQEKAKRLHLTDSEISKVRAAMTAKIFSSSRFPPITEKEFDELIGKVMCIHLTDGSQYILTQKQGCLQLSIE